MRFTTYAGALVAALASIVRAAAPSTSDYSDADVLDGTAFQNVSDIADETMMDNTRGRQGATCTYDNAQIRYEWRDLNQETRKSFTDAVTCLYNTPPQRMTSDQASSYPGIQSRYDEYVATHINYTFNIHATADFFVWHRLFIHYWEQDLINLCGYQGVLPYWNWALDAQAPQDSPLFSGDAYSMGSNGKFIPGRSDTYLYAQQTNMPPGTGGGCVESGPFSNYTTHLGPFDTPNANNLDINDPFVDNPRCLGRDLNPFFFQNYNTFSNITHTMLDQIYVEDFQAVAQGYGNDGNKFGFHGGAHWGGGNQVLDFHSSPNDPLFFLHHGMVDRIFTIWQNLDIWDRQFIISGTSTIGNNPPSAEMQLDDLMPFGFVADDQSIRSAMDTYAGPFCFRYK